MGGNFGPWTLTPLEEQRLYDYALVDDLIGKHAQAHDPLYARDIRNAKDCYQKPPQLWVNIPGLVARTAADLLLPKPPTIKPTVENPELQTRIDSIATRSRLRRVAWRAAYWLSAHGDSYLLISDVPQVKGGKPQPVISMRRASNSLARNVRPEDAPFDRQFVFRSYLPDGTQIFREVLAGRDNWSAFASSGTTQLPDAFKNAGGETREVVPLAVHLSAMREDPDDEGFGEGDSTGCDDLAYEISNRFRQVSKILDRHAEPPMNVPEGALDEEGKLDVSQIKAFSRDQSGNGAEYITWTSQLQEAYTEIDKIMELLSLLTETPAALWGRDKNGLAESGRALKFRLLAGLGKARRSGGELAEGFTEAFRLALRREDVLNGRTPGDYQLTVEMPDTFIADEVEITDKVQKLRAANAMSIRQAVEVGQGLTGKQLDAETAEIEAEGGQSAPLGLETGRFLGGKPGNVTGAP